MDYTALARELLKIRAKLFRIPEDAATYIRIQKTISDNYLKKHKREKEAV